jgi:hypothetical protein
MMNRSSVEMKRRIENDSLSFLILAMAGKTKEKGSVKRKSICVGGFSEIVPYLVERYLSRDWLLIMKGYLITLRKCTYHRNDSLSFAFLVSSAWDIHFPLGCREEEGSESVRFKDAEGKEEGATTHARGRSELALPFQCASSGDLTLGLYVRVLIFLSRAVLFSEPVNDGATPESEPSYS